MDGKGGDPAEKLQLRSATSLLNSGTLPQSSFSQPPRPTNSLVLYCRSGFEKECAAEILERTAALGVHGFVRAVRGTGYVIFSSCGNEGATSRLKEIRFEHLVFCRQFFFAFDEITGLSPDNRVNPIIDFLRPYDINVGEVFVETADTDDSKRILPFCRSFSRHIAQAMKRQGWLSDDPGKNPNCSRLHLFFLSSDRVYAGISDMGNSSGWFMGIPRLKFPKDAPSRSTLKLEEAFHVFLLPSHQSEWLRPGMAAVDLGASPGGWSYQLARRGIRVIAVDNGPMDKALTSSGLVEHVRADGFFYRPARRMDWMVCDIAEQPVRIARLVGRWIGQGWCRRSIFNLKLPMKKRYEEVKRCIGIVQNECTGARVRFFLYVKHLYHDREEVTGYITTDGYPPVTPSEKAAVRP